MSQLTDAPSQGFDLGTGGGRLGAGGIGLFFVTVHCRLASMGKRFTGARTQDIAYAKARGELAYYQLMEARGLRVTHLKLHDKISANDIIFGR